MGELERKTSNKKSKKSIEGNCNNVHCSITPLWYDDELV